MVPVINNKTINNEKPVRVELSTADGMLFVPASTIIRCKALNNYTRFYFFNERNTMLIGHRLRYFEMQLVEADFIRIHRSDLIN